MTFWLLWSFDALIADIIVYFFVSGLARGSVSSFNLGLWLAFLLGLAGILGAVSRSARRDERRRSSRCFSSWPRPPSWSECFSSGRSS